MDWKTPENKRLVEALLALKTADEARRFLRDLMTESEIAELGKRLTAAEMLSKSVPYSTIVERTGLSSTTVARVSKWLTKGTGGYRVIIDRLHHHASPLRERGLR